VHFLLQFVHAGLEPLAAFPTPHDGPFQRSASAWIAGRYDEPPSLEALDHLQALREIASKVRQPLANNGVSQKIAGVPFIPNEYWSHDVLSKERGCAIPICPDARFVNSPDHGYPARALRCPTPPRSACAPLGIFLGQPANCTKPIRLRTPHNHEPVPARDLRFIELHSATSLRLPTVCNGRPCGGSNFPSVASYGPCLLKQNSRCGERRPN